MASRPRKKCAFFNKGHGLQDLESFSIEGDNTVNQACQDSNKVHNLVRDVELIDSANTGINSCSNVNSEKSDCPPITKSSAYSTSSEPTNFNGIISGSVAALEEAKLGAYSTSSEPTNFNGIISGSVAALEESEHSFAPSQTTLNHKGPLLSNCPVDAAFQNSYSPEKKVYTQLLSVQTGQFDAFEPYACSASPGKHKVHSVCSGTIPLSGAEKHSSPSYDKVKKGYSDESNAQQLPPRPYTRRPSQSYSPYPISSPSEECWSSNLNTAKSGWSSHLEGSKSASCSPSSSNSVFAECSPSNKQQQFYSKPISEHRALQNGSLAGTNFNRTVKQYQQPLGNCNHMNSDIPISKSNISLRASVQYDHAMQINSHPGNISYQYRLQRTYLPPSSTINLSSALYRPNLYAPISDQNKHHSGSLGDTGDVEFIASSAALRDRSAPIHRHSPVDVTGPSAFMRVMPQRVYPQHQAPIAVAGPYHSGEPSSPPVIHYNTNNATINGSSCSDDSNPAFPSSSITTEGKRVQSCKLCRNHGVETPIKGHKYLCPYKKCPCHNCSVTLKSRHFVKEQLKITRKQNVSASQHLSDCEEQLNEIKQPPASGVPFTMKEDMVKDMEKLNNLMLFKEIDKICRPQSSVKDSTTSGKTES